ncbi:Protein CBG06039 [Caenorhabditis briggsae]|uniref:Protein CBG06039 n=1 Tax=Caenorhabditis briggsae TaxID=6238 RepID=A8X117_CAEBR|nr:Protein CBG06039 [Caenorhabditis briggsae]CAP26327.2 Protein CBG06039 [Caenorhabditis briggsae]
MIWPSPVQMSDLTERDQPEVKKLLDRLVTKFRYEDRINRGSNLSGSTNNSRTGVAAGLAQRFRDDDAAKNVNSPSVALLFSPLLLLFATPPAKPWTSSVAMISFLHEPEFTYVFILKSLLIGLLNPFWFLIIILSRLYTYLRPFRLKFWPICCLLQFSSFILSINAWACYFTESYILCEHRIYQWDMEDSPVDGIICQVAVRRNSGDMEDKTNLPIGFQFDDKLDISSLRGYYRFR